MKRTDLVEYYGKHEANGTNQMGRALLPIDAGALSGLSPRLSHQECSRSRPPQRGEKLVSVETRHGLLYTSELFQYLAYVKSPSVGLEAEEC